MNSCRNAFLLIGLTVLSNIAMTQKEDYTWILGYSSSRQNADPTVGTTIVRFANEQLHMTRDTIEANFNHTSS